MKVVVLVPRWSSKQWWNPLQIIAESHVVLPKNETLYIPGKVEFQSRKMGMMHRRGVVSIEGKFQDEDIEDDMILGYPWLLAN